MAVSYVRDWQSTVYDDVLFFLASSELSLTDQLITFGDSQEIGVGMLFPVSAGGAVFGKGYYQLSQQQKQQEQSFHQPVMVNEVLSRLLTNRRGVYLDLTVGGGGHARALLQQLSQDGKLMGMDQDDEALAACAENLKPWENQVVLKHANFKYLADFLSEENVESVDGILLDLGVSSHQLNVGYRGFSFMNEGPLDMRMDRRQKKGAYHVVNTYSESELRRVIWEYGEEHRAGAIAKAVVRAREQKKIDSTASLAAVVAKAVHPGHLNKSLARVFQSLRIEVNWELENLRLVLQAGMDHLKPGGRMVVLSYHSLEDRLVKRFFRENEKRCTCPPEFPQCICGRPGTLKILTKRPVTAGAEEVEKNPRARSAKLRTAERL